MGLRLLKVAVCLVAIAFISGCSTQNGKVLVLSEYTPDSTYVYDDSGNSYVMVDDLAIPIGKRVTQSPTLPLLDTHGDFTLTYSSIGKYTGSVVEASTYVNTLIDSGYLLKINKQSGNVLDLVLNNGNIEVRVIISNDNVIRVYSVNNDNIGVSPPYTNEETLDIINVRDM